MKNFNKNIIFCFLISCNANYVQKIPISNFHCSPNIIDIKFENVNSFENSYKRQKKILFYYNELKKECYKIHKCWQESFNLDK